MSEVICGFKDLVNVSVDSIPLDLPAILHLGTLSNLTDLRANPSDEIALADFQSQVSPQTGESKPSFFPSLRAIDIGNRFLARCTHFLRLVSSPALDSVYIQNFGDPGSYSTADDISDLCLELSRHPSVTTASVFVSAMRPGEHLGPQTFAPLLALSRLRVLVLDLAHTADFGDVFLADMAAAWPNIVRLELGVERLPPSDPAAFRPRATLAGLVPFVQLCPKLRGLGVPVRADIAHVSRDDPELNGAGSGRRSRVHYLKVGLSVVHDPAATAAFLSDLFPELKHVQTATGVRVDGGQDGVATMLEDIGAGWLEVSRLVAESAEMRKQERNLAAAQGRGPPPADAFDDEELPYDVPEWLLS